MVSLARERPPRMSSQQYTYQQAARVSEQLFALYILRVQKLPPMASPMHKSAGLFSALFPQKSHEGKLIRTSEYNYLCHPAMSSTNIYSPKPKGKQGNLLIYSILRTRYQFSPHRCRPLGLTPLELQPRFGDEP